MMTVTTEEKLIEALRMLEETRNYLLRLPPVPVTTERIHKMSAFLNAPDNDLLMRRQVPRRGELVHPTGVILAVAELRGDQLRLWQDPLPSGFKMPPVPLSGDGITINLRLESPGFKG